MRCDFFPVSFVEWRSGNGIYFLGHFIQDAASGLSAHSTNAIFGKNGGAVLVPFGSPLTCRYILRISRGKILLLVPLSLPGMAFHIRSQGSLSILSSLAKSRRVNPSARPTTIRCFSISFESSFWREEGHLNNPAKKVGNS